uniref:Calmodulin n=1 Tax=Siphoviridae sp. ctxvK3 TaxID=2827975 RepID=A0A8S5SG38_9CAUD|nr:MAG TPA: calmodulin [Siphoviridae sp. ctxvK3]
MLTVGKLYAYKRPLQYFFSPIYSTITSKT